MKGDIFPSETAVSADPVTGVRITRLTRHLGHSYHLYFTNNGWYDDGRRLLFVSDRHDQTNLYSLELSTGRITQLTEDAVPAGQLPRNLHGVCVNPTRPEAYFWKDRELRATDLTTLAERPLHLIANDWTDGSTSCSADGRFVCTNVNEDVSVTRGITRQGSVGYRDIFLAKPLSRVIAVPTDDGLAQTLHEDRVWIQHVNTSPTRAELLTFCHEGPWHEVDQRIWGLDRSTGKVWKIRPQEKGDAIGHEYWMRDGEMIGYHGDTPAGLVYGAIRYDNTSRIEAPFPHDSRHFHSHSLDLIVGDGRPDFPYILLWRFRDGAFDGPRVLCWHRGSSHVHQTHQHPRFSPDGRQVIYASDESGYGNIYLADLPEDVGSLMTLDELLSGPRRPWVPFHWLAERRRSQQRK